MKNGSPRYRQGNLFGMGKEKTSSLFFFKLIFLLVMQLMQYLYTIAELCRLSVKSVEE